MDTCIITDDVGNFFMSIIDMDEHGCRAVSSGHRHYIVH